jgi:hypothetical protein
MTRSETVPSSLARTSQSANGALSTGVAVLCACVLLLLPVTRANAAGHHAAGSHAAVGTGHFAGFSPPPQTAHARAQSAHARAQSAHARAQSAHARGNWGRTVRGSAGAKPLLHHRGTRKQEFVSRAQRRRHPAPVAPASGRTEPDLSSLTHRIQRMAPGQGLPGPVPRQILVLVDQDQPKSLASELARRYGLEHISSERVPLLKVRAELMRVGQGRSQKAVLEALQRDSRVRSAQPNQRYLPSTGDGPDSSEPVEADRRSPEQRDRPGLQEAIPQYAPRQLGLPEAHQLALGRNVAIAVIDSAVDVRHPDLRGAVSRSFNAAGRPDVTPDYHGTAVAGIIRAHGLVYGAAPQSEILAVRAFRAHGETEGPTTTTHILISAVDWAVRNGARILNMSFIGAHDPALQQILSVAHRSGVVVVAAAGNGGATAPPAYPAAYPDVIAVTAVDERDHRYEYANRGSYIALAAPGVDILAPVERGGYAYVSGTSFAAAYVSAIAALLLERDPSLDPRTILDLLATGAEDLGPAGRDDDFGAGRVNAFSSLKLLANHLSAKRNE